MPLWANIVQCNRKQLRWYRCFSRSSKNINETAVSKVKEVPIFVLKNKPVFPGLSHVFNVDSIVASLFKDCKKEPVYIGLFFNKRKENENHYDEVITGSEKFDNGKEEKYVRRDIEKVKDKHEIYEYGCVGLVKKLLKEESEDCDIHNEKDSNLLFQRIDNISRIVVDVKQKVKIKKWTQNNVAEIEILKEPSWYPKDSKKLKIYQIEIINIIKEIINTKQRNQKAYTFLLKYYDLQNVIHLSHFIGNVSSSNSHILQKMLEEENVEKKLMKCLEILNEELFSLQMEKELHNELTTKFSKEKKELMMREYIKSLEKQIGHKTEHQKMYDMLFEKYEKIKDYLCDTAQMGISRELQKFCFLNENSFNEYASTYHYLNTVLNIPFGKYRQLNKNVEECERMLNRNHYKMENAKRHILEYLCLHILNRQVKPKILLLVGYPGVGKTSFAKSIAEGLHLSYDVISMNNIFHLNELLGHRKTYVNSYQGKIIHSLLCTQCMNPLIILDEFDKIAFTNFSLFHVFLNLFDTNQNVKFTDLYIDFPIDISNVFFICTANTVQNIPDVLLNRMEIVNLPPYTDIEKVHIFKNYLKRKVELETQIGDDHIALDDRLLLHIIQNYTSENGMRQLYHVMYSIYKRRAYLLLKGNKNRIFINPTNLIYFLNADIVKSRKNDSVFSYKEAGTVTSVAFTELGGQIITIEVTSYRVHFNRIRSSLHRSNSEDFSWKEKNREHSDKEIKKNTNRKCEFFLKDSNVNSLSKEVLHGNTYNEVSINTCKSSLKRNNDHWGDSSEVVVNYDSELSSSVPTFPFEKKRTKSISMEYYTKDMFLNNQKPNLERGELETNLIQSKESPSSIFYAYDKNDSLVKNSTANDGLFITGNVGKVMKESIAIANTYATNLLQQRVPNFQRDYLHIHLTESDIKKDGPSAGINFATSIISFYLQIPIDNLLTMTGEITLYGHILKIGGLVEKFIIAKNYGMHSLIIPKENKYEYDVMIPDYLKQNISVYFVQHYNQVFNFLFEKDRRKEINVP